MRSHQTPTTKASIAIGVTTFNRLDCLQKVIGSIFEFTDAAFDLVVADDGSTDETVEWCRSMGISVHSGSNRGVAWNKNRALCALYKRSTAGVIVLLDNDCVVTEPDWAAVWIDACEKWGHVNALHPTTASALRSGYTPSEIVGGTGTAADPYLCTKISGMCIGSSRIALSKVGFFDSRFKGYGHEHSEWTLRFRRFGYGVAEVEVEDRLIRANIMLAYGVEGLDVPSSSNKSMIYANRTVLDSLKGDSDYRLPWQNEVERAELLAELGIKNEHDHSGERWLG